jgi:hypothetical protein
VFISNTMYEYIYHWRNPKLPEEFFFWPGAGFATAGVAGFAGATGFF